MRDTTEESDAIFPSDDDSTNDSCADDPRERELLKIAPILILKCCSKECLLHLTASDVLKFRQQFNALNLTDRRKWLTDIIYENSHNYSGEQLEVMFFVSGLNVCKQAWCEVLSVSSKRVNSILDSMNKGQVKKYSEFLQ